MSKVVIGREVELSDRRAVFVGAIDGDETVYIRFQNGDDRTYISLSIDAACELRLLLSDDSHGSPKSYPVIKRREPESQWQQVPSRDEGATP